MSLEHWMMFSTFAEQEHFIYPNQDSYSGVIINSNMVAYAPGGLAEFILGKLTCDHKYIVDPMTHAFQHDPDFIKSDNGKGKIKKSVRVLAELYGEPISLLAGKNRLLPENINDYFGLSKRVINFQRDHLREYMQKSDAAKYLDDSDIKPPYALVAPYFFMNDTDWEEWLPENIKFIEESFAITSENNEKLFAEIVIDRGVIIDDNAREKILKSYSQMSVRPQGCLIWVDNFDEQDVSVSELRKFKDFCTNLKLIFNEVINLHGGYFSILLGGEIGGNCLSGVTHGPEFGEYRSVVPVGGGIPIARYYIPFLHSRVKYRDAVQIFSSAGWLDSWDEFKIHVCNCQECSKNLKNNVSNFTMYGEGTVKEIWRGNGIVRLEYPTTETKKRCLRHYLQRKQREFQMVSKAENEVILDEINQSIKAFRPLAGSDAVAHLVRWKKVLES